MDMGHGEKKVLDSFFLLLSSAGDDEANCPGGPCGGRLSEAERARNARRAHLQVRIKLL